MTTTTIIAYVYHLLLAFGLFFTDIIATLFLVQIVFSNMYDELLLIYFP